MRKSIISIILFFALVAYGYAQCTAENDAVQPGENLVYDLKFNWKLYGSMLVRQICRYSR